MASDHDSCVEISLDALDTYPDLKWRWLALVNAGASRDDLAIHLREVGSRYKITPMSDKTTAFVDRANERSIAQNAIDDARDDWLTAEEQRLTAAGTSLLLTEEQRLEYLEWLFWLATESTLSGRDLDEWQDEHSPGNPFIVKFPNLSEGMIGRKRNAIFNAVKKELPKHHDKLWEPFAAAEPGTEKDVLHEHLWRVLDVLVRKHAERLGCSWYPKDNKRLEEMILSYIDPETVDTFSVDGEILMPLLLAAAKVPEAGEHLVEEWESRQRARRR